MIGISPTHIMMWELASKLTVCCGKWAIEIDEASNLQVPWELSSYGFRENDHVLPSCERGCVLQLRFVGVNKP